jgi:DNA topoisomerase-1
LRNRHVDVNGKELRFEFKGKSGKLWKLRIENRRVAKIVKACQELPGQHLFQYVDDDNERKEVTSADVNDYLREISGLDITAKDFRTWAGTVLAAMALSEFEAVDSQARAKRNIKAAIERVASRLGNTVTICRKCYVHPEVFNSYLDGNLLADIKQEVEQELKADISDLRPEEGALLALLHKRLGKELKKPEAKESRRKAREAA